MVDQRGNLSATEAVKKIGQTELNNLYDNDFDGTMDNLNLNHWCNNFWNEFIIINISKLTNKYKMKIMK